MHTQYAMAVYIAYTSTSVGILTFMSMIISCSVELRLKILNDPKTSFAHNLGRMDTLTALYDSLL